MGRLGELHPCSLVVVDLGECFQSGQDHRAPAVAWDWWSYQCLGGAVVVAAVVVVVGYPVAEPGTAVSMMAVAAEQRPHPTGVLG